MFKTRQILEVIVRDKGAFGYSEFEFFRKSFDVPASITIIFVLRLAMETPSILANDAWLYRGQTLSKIDFMI